MSASTVSVSAVESTVSVSVAVCSTGGSTRKCGHCGIGGHDRRNCPSGGAAAERKCGQCGENGHDRRACPSKPVTTTAASIPVSPSAAHLSAMSRAESGPARLIDPATYWAKLGADSGTYPFQRDVHGALHLPLICMSGGGHAGHSAMMKMPEYAWDSDTKLFRRIGPCPGCHS